MPSELPQMSPAGHPSQAGRPSVLCVDDEPDVLESLRDSLRRHFQVTTASSGADGLALLERTPFAVVMSDMRMPGMDGAAFLTRARELEPTTTRVLLTGYADVESAIAAVNKGNIFRFLTKPCARDDLVAALTEAAELHRLMHAERDLLDRTLRGAISALVGVLGLSHPQAFGHASRVKQLALDLAADIGIGETWNLEVAALVSQVGAVALPHRTAGKLYTGGELTPAEREMVDRMPALSEQVLRDIPGLELVRAVLGQARGEAGVEPWPDGTAVPSRILRLALDYDVLTAGGLEAAEAVATLRGRETDPGLVERLARLVHADGGGSRLLEVSVVELAPGMVFARDVLTDVGTVLIARGYTVTPILLERLRNYALQQIREPLLVQVPQPAPAALDAAA